MLYSKAIFLNSNANPAGGQLCGQLVEPHGIPEVLRGDACIFLKEAAKVKFVYIAQLESDLLHGFRGKIQFALGLDDHSLGDEAGEGLIEMGSAGFVEGLCGNM